MDRSLLDYLKQKPVTELLDMLTENPCLELFTCLHYFSVLYGMDRDSEDAYHFFFRFSMMQRRSIPIDYIDHFDVLKEVVSALRPNNEVEGRRKDDLSLLKKDEDIISLLKLVHDKGSLTMDEFDLYRLDFASLHDAVIICEEKGLIKKVLSVDASKSPYFVVTYRGRKLIQKDH